MENLPYLLSVIAAIGLLSLAYYVGRSRAGVTPSPVRMLLSYALLLPAFAIGSCWGILFHAGIGNGTDNKLEEAVLFLAFVLTAITGIYVTSCVRSRRRADGGSSTNAPAPVGTAQRRLAVLGIVVLFALGLTLLLCVIYA